MEDFKNEAQDVKNDILSEKDDSKELDEFEKAVKDIIEDTSFETNSRAETEFSQEETEDKVKTENEENKSTLENPTNEEVESEKKILGKTPEEIDQIINQKTQEAVKQHENTLKDYYEAQKNEITINSQMEQIEQTYQQYEYSVKEIEGMMQKGEITPEQYKDAINKAVNDMHQLRMNYDYLQQYNKQVGLPKIKRTNDEYYQKLQEELPEFKDPIVKKYADSLKSKIYDAGGIDIAQGGFTDYIRDFIAAAVQEAEIRGYQKVKNELQKESAKAKAKSAIPTGGHVQPRVSISTADDIINASTDDLLKYVLN